MTGDGRPKSGVKEVLSRMKYKTDGIGLALRTCLWSWTVALAAVLIFAASIIPLQKQSYQTNLEFRARGVAETVRLGTGKALADEDLKGVMEYCRKMVHADPSLDYLVVTRRDGFCLITDHFGVHSRSNAPPEWRPATRSAIFGIGVVPVLDRRAFHYSQPFDYSSQQLGWIHVGLSLVGYEQSVAALYKQTGFLAIDCILLSLVSSGLYARRLMRPILSLQAVVHRVAGGDLSVRATIDRKDELGSLAVSVNAMTESLLRKDRVLQSVRFAAQQFLATADWKTVIEPILAKIGEAAEVNRVRVFEHRLGEKAPQVADLRHEWVSDQGIRGAPAQSLAARELGGWFEVLERGEAIAQRSSELDPAQASLLEPDGFKSILIVPILVENVLWGFLSLADCHSERLWTEAQRDSIRAAADMLGAAIARQRAQDAVAEAKKTLEQRVHDRTKQLQEQVKAKEKAHRELAEAQHQLVEASRQAGMAEVATSVLHNVGNVLNSVNVAASLINQQARHFRTNSLSKVCSLLEEHRHDLGAFLTTDPKGQLVPEFLSQLAQVQEEQKASLIGETQGLVRSVEHIKEIVAMQQSYARVGGVMEDLAVHSLLEDALRMNEGAFLTHGVTVKREFGEVPLVRVDRHKVLQILVNLLRNANDALKVSARTDRELSLAVGLNGGACVKVTITDNGIGIPRENLTKIFGHGFTTKANGHGFGLHSSALAAKEMGGRLQARSDGPNTGATFVLELPIAEQNETGKGQSQS